MKSPLVGKKVAALLADGFAAEHFTCARSFLVAAGADVRVLSPVDDRVQAWNQRNWSTSVGVDAPVGTAQCQEYDMLVLPGGVMHVDALRQDRAVQAFLQAYVATARPIAAMGHGPQLLIDTGSVRGRRLTSVHSLRIDFIHAGAWWVNEPTVVDRGLLTTRDCGDLLTFNVALLEMLGEAAPEPGGFEPLERNAGSPASIEASIRN